MLALIVIASLLASTQALLGGLLGDKCKAGAVRVPDITTDEYCDRVCDECFCNGGVALANGVCKTVCKTVWYGIGGVSPLAVQVGLSAGAGLTPWTCSKPGGDQTFACQFACTCNANNTVACVEGCKAAPAAALYNALGFVC